MEEDRNGDVMLDSSDTSPSETVRNEFVSDSNQSDLSTSSVSLPLHYLDPPLNIPTGSKTGGYVNFAGRKIFDLNEFVLPTNDDDDEAKKKKIGAAKKRLFPSPVAPSFAEAAETLRKERRDEFSPIYPNETADEVARRQWKRRPPGSLLAKRIRFDDLKRQREENEAQQRFAQQQFHYAPHGYPYDSTQYQHEQLRSFQMAELARVQQEHSGFWPELQQQHRQQQPPPPETTGNSPWFYSNAMQHAPPPPSEPYPY